jgi:1-deoxy-D-xylulose 5-phosphate reductoisomerase
MVSGLEIVLAGLDRRLEDFAQRDPFRLQRDLALADSRDVQEIVDQVRQVGEHPIHARADVLGALGRNVLSQQVQAAAQGRDGIAQFVGQHRQEAVLVAIGAAQGWAAASNSSRWNSICWRCL